MSGWIRPTRSRFGEVLSQLGRSAPGDPWPEDEYKCPRCGRPIPGSYYGHQTMGGVSGPIVIKPTHAEIIQRCLVCGPLGRREVPTTHDRDWVCAEANALADELDGIHFRKEAKLVREGVRRAGEGSLDYLGHALHQLRYSPRVDHERLDDVMAAIGRLW